ncbi:hypothetical protein MCERHM32_01545 [Methylophilaceae bacterium]
MAMKYNVCIIKPAGYLHSGAFSELAELIAYSLEDLGYESSISLNETYTDSRNIIIGAHLLDTSHIKEIKSRFPSTVILNTEQVTNISDQWSNSLFTWITNFEVWDYSNANINFFKKQGITDIKFLSIGYHPKLTRIKKSENQDIDILFYGSTNDRRLKVLNKLKSYGHNVAIIFGAYGEKRDNLISRSKIVLNLHRYDFKIFEVVRVFYLMSNSKAIVAEMSPDTDINPIYMGGFYSTDYDLIAESCNELLQNSFMREALEREGLQLIKNYPQSQLTKLVLE